MREMVLENLNEFFFKSGDELIKEALKNEEYHDLYQEADKLKKDFPILEELMEGKNMSNIHELTLKEREAIKKYMEIKIDMQDCMYIKYYFRGHRDCLLYLMQCGILK